MEDTIEISDNSPVKGMTMPSFSFIEETGDFPGAPYHLYFQKDRTNSGNSFILFIYVEKPLTIKGRLKTTKITLSGGDRTYTRNSLMEWDVSLQAGWNKIQADNTYGETDTPGGSVTDFASIIKNAPADTSDFKWTLQPDFDLEYPFSFGAASHTVTLDGNEWEHASATTFPAGGEWNNTANSRGSSEWIEFDTAAKTLIYHRQYSGNSPCERKGMYRVEANTLKVMWLSDD